MTDSSPLIDVTALDALMKTTPPPTVIDVRYRLGGPSGAEVFQAGHILGATYVDLERDLAAPPSEDRVGGRHPLPEPDAFLEAMRRARVYNNRPVVLYDDWQGRAAGRAWWLLRDYGHRDVRVLDGGYSAWVAAGLPTGTGVVEPPPGDFMGSPGHLSRVDAETLPDFAGTIVDARNPERYSGQSEPVDPVAGHVPGAVNVPTGANLNDDGTFRSAAELAELYPEGDVAVYCGSGVTATHDLLALAVLGREGALYPGSWSDWVSDPDRPVETN